MTDHDLATLLREHVQTHEPPFRMSADTVIALGRRTLVRRRARRAAAGVLVAAAAVAAVPLLPWGWPTGSRDDRTGHDAATTRALEHYDAGRMPALIDQHARAALGSGLDGLGQAQFTAFDDQGAHVPARHYDKASGMTVEYAGTDGERRVEVTLLHARSEAEGDARKMCAQNLRGGIYLSCTVTTSAAGDPVTTTVEAVRPMSRDVGGSGWALVTRDELRTGVASDTSPSGQGPINPADLYFVRRVESVHSDTFLTDAEEIVHAADLATAETRWRVPADDLSSLATDPALVIPKPPLGPGGCPWTWKAKVTCSKSAG